MKMDLIAQQQAGLAPKWLTEDSMKAMSKRLLPGETVQDHFLRVARAAAVYTKDPKKKAEDFYELFWRNILGLSTPMATNFGTNRGLVASCFMTEMHDTLMGESGIYPTNDECAEMAKVGGGVGIGIDMIRSKGSRVGIDGSSNGVVPWMRLLDTTFDVVSQGKRRGSGSVSLNINHGDWKEFIMSKENTGDPRTKVYELHLSTRISNEFMDSLYSKDPEARKRWQMLLQARKETGESYIEFIDHINDALPQWCKDRGWIVKQTNICTEILQPTFQDHSVVCVISSNNLATYDDWKNEDLRVYSLSHEFLDCAVSDFLVNVPKYKYMEKAMRGAMKARAIGLGVMGWHDLLLQRGLAFDNSMEVMRLNADIHRRMKEATDETSKRLAKELGEPEWLKGYGERNGFKMAIAPTKTNSAVSGVVGEGISPIIGASWTKEGAEGDIHVKNPYFEKVLDSYGRNDYATWKSIYRAKGSVQHLDFLSENDKKLYLSAREIDQHKLVVQAAQRGRYIDQGQSLNLFFPKNASAQYINSVHLKAHELGLKTLYYMKSGAPVSGDMIQVCESCS